MLHDLLVENIAALYTMDEGEGRLGRIRAGAVAFREGKVSWVGRQAVAPEAREKLDGSALIALPGLVDAHTHTVWAGSRAVEFERRLSGVSYAQILEEGGGILSTVAATRAASEAELTALATGRLRGMAARGVTTVEVKSGYGLELDSELKMLRAAVKAGENAGVRVVPTFLGAHTVPAEHRARREGYVRDLLEVQIPAVAGLAECIDVYADRGAFTLEEAELILRAGAARGLKVRVHAEQVAFTGAAAMAARLGATSADHLERLDAAGVAAMAAAGTVALLLPGAMIYLRDSPPPVAALRAAGVPIALATDYNPGSSPISDLWAVATLGVLTLGLTVEEAVLGVTRHAGLALGAPHLGVLRAGAAGDLALMAPPLGEPPEIASLIQHFGGHHAVAVVRDGRVQFDRRREIPVH